MRTELVRVQTIKSYLIVQFDKFNGDTSVAISCLQHEQLLIVGRVTCIYL